jgi:hypothetical protein
MAVTGMKIVAYEEPWVGRLPYLLGASVAQTAAHQHADCSSFQQWAYSGFHLDLPRTADQQYRATMTGGGVTSPVDGSWYAKGKTIWQGVNVGDMPPASLLQLADLVFFGRWVNPDNPPGFAGVQHVAAVHHCDPDGTIWIIEEGGINNNVNIANLADFAGQVLYVTRVDGVTEPDPNPPTPPRTAMNYTAQPPKRVLDTRQSGKLAPHTPRTFVVGPGVAVTGNLTVTDQTGAGYLSIGPDPMANPTYSRLNFPLKDDRANSFNSLLGPGGTLSVTYVGPAGTTVDFIIDIDGVFA